MVGKIIQAEGAKQTTVRTGANRLWCLSTVTYNNLLDVLETDISTTWAYIYIYHSLYLLKRLNLSPYFFKSFFIYCFTHNECDKRCAVMGRIWKGHETCKHEVFSLFCCLISSIICKKNCFCISRNDRLDTSWSEEFISNRSNISWRLQSFLFADTKKMELNVKIRKYR